MDGGASDTSVAGRLVSLVPGSSASTGSSGDTVKFSSAVTVNCEPFLSAAAVQRLTSALERASEAAAAADGPPFLLGIGRRPDEEQVTVVAACSGCSTEDLIDHLRSHGTLASVDFRVLAEVSVSGGEVAAVPCEPEATSTLTASQFRPNVAVLVLDHSRARALQCLRIGTSDSWQLPQGGVDEGEDVAAAAVRELQEETGIDPALVERVAHTSSFFPYCVQPEAKSWLQRKGFVGQRQQWHVFALRKDYSDADLDAIIRFDAHPEEIEFTAWRWTDPRQLPSQIVDIKQGVYEKALLELGFLGK
jgi:putative (di)nucleoside polyphosphate hydrolase